MSKYRISFGHKPGFTVKKEPPGFGGSFFVKTMEALMDSQVVVLSTPLG